MKICFKCLTPKHLSEFYKHAQMGDGLLGKCKECTKRDTAASRLAKLEHYRQYDRKRSSMPHRVTQRKMIGKRWRRQYPYRRYAQGVLNKAIRAGKIAPLPCLVCGDTRMVEAHHPDYSMPLDVIWLCVPHHRQTHAMARKAA